MPAFPQAAPDMPTLVERYGKWALVAGASEGIGAAFARALAEAGFALILIARREPPLHALADQLRARSAQEILTVPLDLADPDLESHLRALAQDRDIGLIVYNAALSTIAPFLEIPLADKQRSLAVNAHGPLVACHVFGEQMAARRRGAIVLLSSLTAFWGSPWVATYGATKAFNLSLGEALAHELAPYGIDVVVSCAGATRTPGFLQAVAGRKPPASMSPDDVAAETLRALQRGRGAFVPGRFNRFAQLVLTRLLPRRTAIQVMAGHTRALLRDVPTK